MKSQRLILQGNGSDFTVNVCNPMDLSHQTCQVALLSVNIDGLRWVGNKKNGQLMFICSNICPQQFVGKEIVPFLDAIHVSNVNVNEKLFYFAPPNPIYTPTANDQFLTSIRIQLFDENWSPFPISPTSKVTVLLHLKNE